MNEPDFPSGPWVGFYNYQPDDKHRMDLNLTFDRGILAGTGNDDVAPFVINGEYDAKNAECHWTKSYPGSHDVFYRGFREGKGIWGTWEIHGAARGGFHIWPRSASEGTEITEYAGQREPVSATAGEGDITLRRPG